MAKFCKNGHQMEDGWDDCPYCQRTGYQRQRPASSSKTRLDGTGLSAEINRLDATQDYRSLSAAGAGGKTVLLASIHRSPVVGWLVALNGVQKGEDFRLREGQNVLGSAPGSDVQLQDAAISAKHASIRYKDGAFSLTDLDSTNGTFLNDSQEPIARETLKDNDLLRLGEVSLKFKCL